jgi:hypothetical protein
MPTWGIYPGMWISYVPLVPILFLGMLLRGHRTLPAVAAATLSASVIFYLVTNFAVWACWDLYPRTLAGLLECYTMALPFFWNTLGGDAIYSAVLFGGFALAEKHFPVLRELPGSIVPEHGQA